MAGTLTISPELKDGVLSAGTISIHKNGALQLGSRDKPFKGTFMLNLNSSLHEFGPHAVSYLDVYGSLQLKSADIETADETVPAWTCTDIRNATFLLQGISSADVIKRGSRLGVTSSHGEEVVTVDSYSQGLVTLTKPLRVAHGNKAIVYNLSHRIRIRGSGNTAIRVWNGQPDAGGTVDAKEPAFHHHRRLHCAAHAAGVTLPRCDASGSGSPPAARTLLQSSSLARRPRSDVGYQDTNIYRSSLKQPQLAGKVELHGVEISGLGVPLGPQAQAALAMTDYACAVRWPDFRKYISLMSLSMHSLKAGCIDFHGCTGGFEVCCHNDMQAVAMRMRKETRQHSASNDCVNSCVDAINSFMFFRLLLCRHCLIIICIGCRSRPLFSLAAGETEWSCGHRMCWSRHRGALVWKVPLCM